ESYQFARKALDLAIGWPHHNEQTLGDLVERLQAIPDDEETVWNRIRKWIASKPHDEEKARLRERIQRCAFTRRGRHLPKAARDHARETYDLLAPHDPIIRHQWLFAQQWVEASFDELMDAELDYQKREERIAKLRAAAIAEIWKAAGYDGIRRLCKSGEASFAIGWHLAAGAVKRLDVAELLYRLASEPTTQSPARVDGCLSGFLLKSQDETREQLVETLIGRFGAEGEAGCDKTVRLLKVAPFTKSTWRHVDRLGPDMQSRYWKEVSPGWGCQNRD